MAKITRRKFKSSLNEIFDSVEYNLATVPVNTPFRVREQSWAVQDKEGRPIEVTESSLSERLELVPKEQPSCKCVFKVKNKTVIEEFGGQSKHILNIKCVFCCKSCRWLKSHRFSVSYIWPRNGNTFLLNYVHSVANLGSRVDIRWHPDPPDVLTLREV